jgi:hypothetical protein
MGRQRRAERCIPVSDVLRLRPRQQANLVCRRLDPQRQRQLQRSLVCDDRHLFRRALESRRRRRQRAGRHCDIPAHRYVHRQPELHVHRGANGGQGNPTPVANVDSARRFVQRHAGQQLFEHQLHGQGIILRSLFSRRHAAYDHHANVQLQLQRQRPYLHLVRYVPAAWTAVSGSDCQLRVFGWVVDDRSNRGDQGDHVRHRRQVHCAQCRRWLPRGLDVLGGSFATAGAGSTRRQQPKRGAIAA